MTVQSGGKVRRPGVSVAVPTLNQARNLSQVKLAGSRDGSTLPLRGHAGSAGTDGPLCLIRRGWTSRMCSTS